MSFRYINIYIGVRAKGEDETVARSRNSTFVKLYVQFKLHFVKKRCAKILLLSPDKWSAHPRNDFKRQKKNTLHSRNCSIAMIKKSVPNIEKFVQF